MNNPNIQKKSKQFNYLMKSFLLRKVLSQTLYHTCACLLDIHSKKMPLLRCFFGLSLIFVSVATRGKRSTVNKWKLIETGKGRLKKNVKFGLLAEIR